MNGRPEPGATRPAGAKSRGTYARFCNRGLDRINYAVKAHRQRPELLKKGQPETMKQPTVQITVSLSDRERISVEQFARRHSVSPEEAFRTALFEKIEDEADLAIAEQAYREYHTEGKHSRPISEMRKELSL